MRRDCETVPQAANGPMKRGSGSRTTLDLWYFGITVGVWVISPCMPRLAYATCNVTLTKRGSVHFPVCSVGPARIAADARQAPCSQVMPPLHPSRHRTVQRRSRRWLSAAGLLPAMGLVIYAALLAISLLTGRRHHSGGDPPPGIGCIAWRHTLACSPSG
jgi:hypothetical protein